MLEISCWVDGQEPFVGLTHTLLPIYTRVIEGLFKDIKFGSIELLLYPELNGLSMDEDSYVVLEPNFSFIKKVLREGRVNALTCEDGSYIKLSVFNDSVIDVIQGVETYRGYKLVHVGSSESFTTHVYEGSKEVGRINHGPSTGYTYPLSELLRELGLNEGNTLDNH